jgi:hypothetical protein
MKDLLLLSILIEKYKKQMKCIELPSTFEKKEKEEQIELLIKALENNETLEDLIDNNKQNLTK